MILTNCAACAAPLPRPAKQCSRCKTLYCGPACQRQHWERGGHDALCKKIKKGGGAEQYHADKKYKEAVAVAAEACADDTKGQTCYICTQALHWKTKEGLVRMCSCRGTAGFAHVSCLAEQAKILVAEAEENNLGFEVKIERWQRWYRCGMCEQNYHGVVRCALGWACWKTYLGRPEGDLFRCNAMRQLGNGLFEVNHHEEALSVREAELSMVRRVGAPEDHVLAVQTNLANSYAKLGKSEQALRMLRDIYTRTIKLFGEEGQETITAAINYASDLCIVRRFKKAKSVLLKTMPVARRVLGEGQEVMLKLRARYAMALYHDDDATLDDLREAVGTFEDTARIARRFLGGEHPTTRKIEHELRNARAALRARETPPESS